MYLVYTSPGRVPSNNMHYSVTLKRRPTINHYKIHIGSWYSICRKFDCPMIVSPVAALEILQVGLPTTLMLIGVCQENIDALIDHFNLLGYIPRGYPEIGIRSLSGASEHLC